MKAVILFLAVAIIAPLTYASPLYWEHVEEELVDGKSIKNLETVLLEAKNKSKQLSARVGELEDLVGYLIFIVLIAIFAGWLGYAFGYTGALFGVVAGVIFGLFVMYYWIRNLVAASVSFPLD